jgi:tetratricopeptide (TPR) repeat protein
MTHQIVFVTLENLQVSLSCYRDQVIAAGFDFSQRKSVNLSLLNLSTSRFQFLLQLKSSQICRFFQYFPMKNLLVFNEGLKGGGCGTSKSKKHGILTVSEANMSHMASPLKLNQREVEVSSDIKYPSLSEDFELTYLEEEAQNNPLYSKDNIEKQLSHANSDRLLANYYLEVGKRKEAKQKFIQSYSIFIHFLPKGDELLTELSAIVGQLSFELEDMEESLEFFTKALKNCYENIDLNQKNIFEVCFGIAQVYAKLEDVENFQDFFKFIEKDLKSLNVEKEIEFYFWVGEKFMKTDCLTSNRFLMKAWELLEKVPSFNKKKELLIDLGSISSDLKSWEESKDFNIKALKIVENLENPNTSDFVKIYKNLCKVYENLGDRSNLKQANESLLKYQTQLSEADESLAKSLFNLGLIQIKEGEVLKAIDSFKKSVEIRVALGKKAKDCQVAYKNIASTLYNLKRFQEAKEYFNILLEIHRSSKSDLEIAEVLCNIGTCCVETEDFIKAREVYSELLTNENWNNQRKDVEADFFSFAWVLSKLEIFEESAKMYEKAAGFELKKDDVNFEFLTKCFNNAENSFCKVQNYEKALSCAQENLKIMKAHFKNDRVKINTLKSNIEFYRRS